MGNVKALVLVVLAGFSALFSLSAVAEVKIAVIDINVYRARFSTNCLWLSFLNNHYGALDHIALW